MSDLVKIISESSFPAGLELQSERRSYASWSTWRPLS